MNPYEERDESADFEDMGFGRGEGDGRGERLWKRCQSIHDNMQCTLHLNHKGEHVALLETGKRYTKTLIAKIHPNTWEEYDAAAKWCAQRDIKGDDGDPLPDNLSSDCFWAINDDPEAFARRIRETAYALAMEKHDESV